VREVSTFSHSIRLPLEFEAGRDATERRAHVILTAPQRRRRGGEAPATVDARGRHVRVSLLGLIHTRGYRSTRGRILETTFMNITGWSSPDAEPTEFSAAVP